MQNRLDGAAEAQAASEKQLAELHSAIAAERVARPESVSPLRSFFFFLSTDHLWGSFYIHFMFIFFSPFLGEARRGTRSAGFREESIYRAARRTRGIRRV